MLIPLINFDFIIKCIIHYQKMFLVGKSAVLRTYEEPKKEGIFCGSDLHVCHFYIKQFKTPHGTIPHALVRTADIIDMHVDNVI